MQQRKRRRQIARAKHRAFQKRQRTRSRVRGRTAKTYGELKFFDTSFSDAIVSATGTVIPSLSLIAQGVTETERIGRRCTIRVIQMNFTISLPTLTAQAVPPPHDVVRIIVYVDHQTNGATIGVSGPTGFLNAADYLGYRELVNGKRFTTIMDRSYALAYTAGTGITASQDYASVAVQDSLYKKVTIPIEYHGSAGAITEMRGNNIGFLAISQNGNGGFIGTMRLRFSDD